MSINPINQPGEATRQRCSLLPIRQHQWHSSAHQTITLEHGTTCTLTYITRVSRTCSMHFNLLSCYRWKIYAFLRLHNRLSGWIWCPCCTSAVGLVTLECVVCWAYVLAQWSVTDRQTVSLFIVGFLAIVVCGGYWKVVRGSLAS